MHKIRSLLDQQIRTEVGCADTTQIDPRTRGFFDIEATTPPHIDPYAQWTWDMHVVRGVHDHVVLASVMGLGTCWVCPHSEQRAAR